MVISRVDDLTLKKADIALPVGARLVARDAGTVIYSPAVGDAADLTFAAEAGDMVSLGGDRGAPVIVGTIRGSSTVKRYRVVY